MISVIVTAFNEGVYIKRCLESLIKQQVEKKQYEIIVVDDGSTDSSVELMDQFNQKTENIKIIHKRNEGSINSRLRGVKEAKGDYVTFVDGDDFVSEDYIKKILKIIQTSSVDMYVLNNFINKVKTNNFYSEKAFLKNKEKITVNQIYSWVLTGKAGAVWDKVYKRSLMLKALKYDEIPPLFYGEDVYINSMYLKYCKTIFTYDISVYYHVLDSNTSGSITNKSFKKIDDIDKLYLVIRKLNQEKIISDITFNNFCVVYIDNIAKIVGDLLKFHLAKKEINDHLTHTYIISNKLTNVKARNYKDRIYIICLQKKMYFPLRVIRKFNKV